MDVEIRKKHIAVIYVVYKFVQGNFKNMKTKFWEILHKLLVNGTK